MSHNITIILLIDITQDLTKGNIMNIKDYEIVQVKMDRYVIEDKNGNRILRTETRPFKTLFHAKLALEDFVNYEKSK